MAKKTKAKRAVKAKAKNEEKDVHLLVRCPTCRKSLEYSTDNPFRPFCSDRCKTQDIAAWASERYAVPGSPLTDEEDLESEE